eukprot:CAMPEP_0117594382 /NCGR_PEP_ID=MMETSP0784-20121206/73170_1 /TAXON_ID=39447 /ORGANISM="" /LENGTH=58 /DNA_ID=CAMNT_0005396435 /DNA_START=172 /DNA_END=348 /DNA_ORIENTATION=+
MSKASWSVTRMAASTPASPPLCSQRPRAKFAVKRSKPMPSAIVSMRCLRTVLSCCSGA